MPTRGMFVSPQVRGVPATQRYRLIDRDPYFRLHTGTMEVRANSTSRRVPFEKRKRASASCDKCRTKRIKCHRVSPEAPCTNCLHQSLECVTLIPRKKRVYTSVEESRYRAVDKLLERIFPGRSVETTEDITSLIDEVSQGYHNCERLGINNDVLEQQPVHRQVEHQSVVYNLQGRSRYIGPSGTLFFLSQLKRLLSETESKNGQGDQRETIQQAYALDKQNDLIAVPDMPSPEYVNRMLAIYFDSIHPDMLIFNQGEFTQEVNRLDSALEAPAATVCSAFALFVAVLDCQRGDNNYDYIKQRQEFWSVVQNNLGIVVNGSGIKQIQCLLLIAQIFHNNNERNTTWNLIGVAIRTAYSMGLHREGALTTRDGREDSEVKRRVWWTLYEYERFLAVSLGRPTAIDDSWINIDYPTEKYPFPVGYNAAQCKIFQFVGELCQWLYHPEKPILAASIAKERLNGFEKWFTELPIEITNFAIYTGQALRPVLMLNIYYHWTVTLLTRPFLIGTESKGNTSVPSPHSDTDAEHLSQKCEESALKSVKLLCRDLWQTSNFNCRSWLDVFFVYSSTSILAVSLLRNSPLSSEVQSELENSLKVLDDCQLHGTMARLAAVSKEVVQVITKKKKSTSIENTDIPALQGPFSGVNPNHNTQDVDILDFFNLRWLYSMETL